LTRRTALAMRPGSMVRSARLVWARLVGTRLVRARLMRPGLIGTRAIRTTAICASGACRTGRAVVAVGRRRLIVATTAVRSSRGATWRARTCSARRARLACARCSLVAATRTRRTSAGAATTWTILANMVEATQLAAFVRHRAVDVGLALAILLVDGDFGACLALADDRLQGQHLRTALESEFALQCFDFLERQFLRLATLEQARQGQCAVADTLEPADLELLRFPQAPHFTIASLGDNDAEP